MLIGRLRILLAPVVLATVLIYILNPIVGRLHRVGLHRVVGSLVAFSLMIGSLALLGALITPRVVEQARELGSDFPSIYARTASEIEDLASDLGFGDIEVWSYSEMKEYINDPEVQDRFFSAALDRLGEITSGLLETILVFLIAPVVAFYLLIDLPRVRRQIEALVPDQHLSEVQHVSRQLGTAVGGFLRGQVIVALIVGILTSAGFYLIDLKFWLIIGMIAGFLNIIPFVGPWVGGALGVFVGLITADINTAVSAAIVALIVQQIDNNFVSPAVLRATVRLHPALVLLVLILGGGIGGVWGVLLAVPVAASLKIIFGHLWKTKVLGQSWNQASEAFIEGQSKPETLRVLSRRIFKLGGKRQQETTEARDYEELDRTEATLRD